MTVTELRQELERLEAAGKGNDYILEIVTERRWVEKCNTNTSWRELTEEHWIKLED